MISNNTFELTTTTTMIKTTCNTTQKIKRTFIRNSMIGGWFKVFQSIIAARMTKIQLNAFNFISISTRQNNVVDIT